MANFIDLEEMNVFNKIRKKVLSGSTNQIIYNNKGKKGLTTILPAYVRIKLNTIAEISYSMLKAEIHCDFYFTINVTGLEECFIDFLKTNVALFFNNGEPIELKEDHEEVEIYLEEEIQTEHNRLVYHYLHFEMRKVLTTSLVPNIFWTPFETADLVLTINPKVPKLFQFQAFYKKHKKLRDNLNDIYFNKKKPVKTIKFTFNCMDCQNEIDKINFPLKAKFGNYRIATSMLVAQYTNSSTTKLIREHSEQLNKKRITSAHEEDLSQVKQFQIAHFILTIYKNPNSAIATIFVPIWLLSFINMGIFYQSNQLSGRIENLAGLMFAFVAVVTVIRQQIPPNRQITFIEYLVYTLTFTTLICLIQGLMIRNDQNFTPQFFDPFFFISLIISILSLIIIMVLLILHRCIWLPSYRRKNIQVPSSRFNHLNWGNIECDKHFLKFFDNGSVKALIYNDIISEPDDQ